MAMFSRQKKDEAPRRRQSVHAGDTRREAAERFQAEQEASNTMFRRNRTLTGSLSSRVVSANEHKADLKSARIQAHDLTKQRRKIGAVLGMIVLVCAVLAGILLQFTARPVVDAADGSVALHKQRYEKAIDEYLSRHPVERLRFVLDAGRLSSTLRQQLPEVSSVTAGDSAGFGASHFTIGVRKPLASWIIGSDQYFVDANGVSFKVNYYELPTVKIVDQSGVQQAAGTAIASSRFLNFVGRVVSLSKSRGILVEQAIIPHGTTREVELRLQGREYGIKFSLDRSVGEQVEDMQRAIEYFDTKKIAVDYIDVRVPGKAFYKSK